jgi:phage tail-like protein
MEYIMSNMGEYRKLYPSFKFQVRISGFASAAFSKCDGLSWDVDEMTYAEGGMHIDYKEPGKVKFGDVTLDRGVSQDTNFIDWILQVVNVMAKLPGGVGVPSPQFMRDVVVRQLDRDDTVAIDWILHWGWPKKFTPGSWDNKNSEFTLEQLVVAYHHPERRAYA